MDRIPHESVAARSKRRLVGIAAAMLIGGAAVYYFASARRAPDRAIADRTRAIQLDPDGPAGRRARVTRQTLPSASEKGESDPRIADHTKVIALRPDDAEAYNNRALAYVVNGDHDCAMADFTKAVELDPDGGVGRQARDVLRLIKGSVTERLRSPSAELRRSWRRQRPPRSRAASGPGS